MPSCLNCQTPYEEGQKFCKTCGTELSAGMRQSSCPACGTQLSNQAFCHACGTRLDAASTRQDRLPVSPPGQRQAGFIDKLVKGYPLQILGLVGGCLAILVLAFVGISWLSGDKNGSMPPEINSQAPKIPGASAQPPVTIRTTPEVLGPPFFSKPTKIAELGKSSVEPAPAVHEPGLSLKEELEETLFKMRRGQEQKDIDLYMSCFSPSFPELEKKKKETLTRWVVYDFTHLVFNIEDVQEIAADNHIALVTWEVKARNRNNQKVESFNQRFKVAFIKDQGQQLIKSLEKEGMAERE